MPAQPVRPVYVNAPDVSLGPADEVVITNADLVNALVQDQAEALQLLSGVNPVKLEEISIDSEGRVVIANSAFAQALRANLSKAPQPSALAARALAANNGVCGVGCGKVQ